MKTLLIAAVILLGFNCGNVRQPEIAFIRILATNMDLETFFRVNCSTFEMRLGTEKKRLR